MFPEIFMTGIVTPVMFGQCYPNITGWVNAGKNADKNWLNWIADGALFYDNGSTGGQASLDLYDGRKITFSPARVNSIFGRTNSVQNPAIQILIIIKT